MKTVKLIQRVISCGLALLWFGFQSSFAQTNVPPDLERAVTALEKAGCYTWFTKIHVVGQAASIPRPDIKGCMTTNKIVIVEMARNELTNRFVFKDQRVAIQAYDGRWLSKDEATAGSDTFGPGLFTKLFLESFKPPHEEVRYFIMQAVSFIPSTNVYECELSKEAAAKILAWRLPQPTAVKPEVINPRVTVKFVLDDGNLSKYEVHHAGLLRIGEVERTIDRTVEVRIVKGQTFQYEIPQQVWDILK